MLGTQYNTPSAESIILRQRLMILNHITCLLAKAYLRLGFWLAIYLYQEITFY